MTSPHPYDEAPELDLSVVVVSFNTRQLTLEALTSICKHTQSMSYELIVIDNNSSDDSADAIAREFPQATLIRNDANKGFSAAANAGFRICKGRYVVLFNSDAQLIENSFKKMKEFLDGYPDGFILSPQIIDGNDRPVPMRLWDITPFDSILKIIGRYSVAEEAKRMGPPLTRTVKAVGGSCLMMRRDLFASIGLMDEQFFLYNEEDDLCRRARKRGHKIFYYPETSVRHLHSQSASRPQSRALVICKAYQSDLRFFKKYYSLFWNLLLRLAYKTVFTLAVVKSTFRRIRGIPCSGADDSARLKMRLLMICASEMVRRNDP
ncbi:MAG: glycosyltransferase family 2 protein [Candidatus Nitrohelix vancouverensis]|uniref:Glycosyltransferase family 2 protein n=1 Tax=Candidatus Nitrohelix vancouverensis TaxID=2705534 RepID=A0A7T0C1Z0_9BACT|nr:MAG: glycosyltransferase family 2 protein [Candidatus Nitrohelix vancouverensis]